MRLHKFGHACLAVETDDATILVDPGGFSSGYENLTDLTAVLITHAHGDHLNVDNLVRIREKNPEAKIIADRESCKILSENSIEAVPAEDGSTFDLGIRVEALGHDHAVIHPELPMLVNHGYMIADRIFHPGDAFTVPDRSVEILALPIGAPWLKSSEFIEYLRAVKPEVAIPIHDAVLAKPQISHNLVDQLGPDNTRYEIIEDGESISFT